MSDPTTGQAGERPSRASASKQMRGRGLGTLHRRGAVWWVQYCFRGKVSRESSHSVARMDAVKLLRRRLEEMGRGRLGPDVSRV